MSSMVGCDLKVLLKFGGKQVKDASK